MRWGTYTGTPYKAMNTGRWILLPAFVALVSCASGSGAGSIGPGTVPGQNPDARAIEREAVLHTAPEGALQIIFEWRAREREGRFEGRGAARVQDPYHARLDLFGPRGEGYLSAALVGDELRLPRAGSEIELPPPALLWSVLGIFHPPQGAELVATQRDGRKARLDYRRGGDRWRFEFEDGRLRRAEWVPNGGGKHTVELRGDAAYSLPAEAVYRDWVAFTELTLKLDEAERVEPFPPDVWTPGGP